jgi:hypothetical protein
VVGMDIDPGIRDYLDRYADSLTRFDAEAAAELWSTPGMIVDDRFSGVLESRDAMVAGLEQSYPLYRQLGLATVGWELLAATSMTDAITQVQVRWLFYDGDGRLLTDSTSYYVLRRDDDGLRACVCIQTDDLEKLQALAAEHGIPMPSS